jgi:hypothetical protein
VTDGTTYAPCVGSGMCCKKSPCPYGEADETGACRFLEVWEDDELDVERYRCGRYDEIVGQPTADVAPAFGAGCCMTMFNERRREVLVQLGRRTS